MSHDDDEELLAPFPELEALRVLRHDPYTGTLLVKNAKLGGRKEILKYLRSFEPLSKEHFEREAKILGVMNHHTIPKIYDLIRHDDTVYFRNEHVNGFSLEEILYYCNEKKITIPDDVATTIIVKLMHALQYAHKGVTIDGRHSPIMHKDIKPSNIMISMKNCQIRQKPDKTFINHFLKNKGEPHLIDFGIAEFKGSKADTQHIQGTIAYMSPQQLEGKQET